MEYGMRFITDVMLDVVYNGCSLEYFLQRMECGMDISVYRYVHACMYICVCVCVNGPAASCRRNCPWFLRLVRCPTDIGPRWHAEFRIRFDT